MEKFTVRLPVWFIAEGEHLAGLLTVTIDGRRGVPIYRTEALASDVLSNKPPASKHEVVRINNALELLGFLTIIDRRGLNHVFVDYSEGKVEEVETSAAKAIILGWF